MRIPAGELTPFPSGDGNGLGCLGPILIGIIAIGIAEEACRSAFGPPAELSSTASVARTVGTIQPSPPTPPVEACQASALWASLEGFIETVQEKAGEPPTQGPYETTQEFEARRDSWEIELKGALDAYTSAEEAHIVDVPITRVEYVPDVGRLWLKASEKLHVPRTGGAPALICDLGSLLECDYSLMKPGAFLTVRDRAYIEMSPSQAQELDILNRRITLRLAYVFGTTKLVGGATQSIAPAVRARKVSVVAQTAGETPYELDNAEPPKEAESVNTIPAYPPFDPGYRWRLDLSRILKYNKSISPCG